MKTTVLKYSVFIFLFTLPVFLFGQSVEVPFFENRIYITPFAIYDRENPSIRFRYERIFGNDFSFLLGGGIIYTLYDRDSMHVEDSKNRGIVFNSELRKYLFNSPFYLGTRFFYLKSDNVRVYAFSDPLMQSSVDFRKALRIEKNIMASQITMGLAGEFGNGFIIDLELGIGIAQRDVALQSYPQIWGEPVFDRNIRADISNRNDTGWFFPYPYFQLHLGWGWN